MLRSVFCLPNRSKRYQINDFSLRSFNVVWTNRYRSFSEMKTLHKFFGPLKEIALVKLIDCVVWYSYSLWSASLMTLDSRASQCVIFASESHSSVKLRTNEIESVGVWKVVRCLAIGPFSVLTFRHSVNCYGINDTRLHLSHHLSSWTPISYFVMLFQLRFMFLTLRQSSFCPIFCPSIRFHCVLFFCYFIEQLNLLSIYLAHGFRFLCTSKIQAYILKRLSSWIPFAWFDINDATCYRMNIGKVCGVIMNAWSGRKMNSGK